MKKTLSSGFLLVLVLLVALAAGPAYGEGGASEKVPVFVGFTHQPGPTEEALVRKAGGEVKYTYNLVPAIAASLPAGAIQGLLKNPNVGILFVDFEGQQRLRLQGVASIVEDDELLAEYPEAQFIVRVDLTEVYKNCPRYIHKYQLVEASAYVPRPGQETPEPEWKRSDELSGLLPKKNPG